MANEAKAHGVCISVLCPGPVKTEFDSRARVASSLKGLDCADVAEYTVKKLLKGKEVIIPGASIRLLKFTTRFLSDRFAVTLTAKAERPKSGAPLLLFYEFNQPSSLMKTIVASESLNVSLPSVTVAS